MIIIILNKVCQIYHIYKIFQTDSYLYWNSTLNILTQTKTIKEKRSLDVMKSSQVYHIVICAYLKPGVSAQDVLQVLINHHGGVNFQRAFREARASFILDGNEDKIFLNPEGLQAVERIKNVFKEIDGTEIPERRFLEDYNTIQEKFTTYLVTFGQAKMADFNSWAKLFFLPSSYKTLEKVVVGMKEKKLINTIPGMQGTYYLCSTIPSRLVVHGERQISSDPFKVGGSYREVHWGVKVVMMDSEEDPISKEGEWWEVMGKYQAEDHQMIINSGVEDLMGVGPPGMGGLSSPTGTKAKKVVGMTSKTNVEIFVWVGQWVRDHPTYNLYGGNCQDFSNGLRTFLGVNI